MTLLSLNTPVRSVRPFWDSFRPILPEAVRCQLFHTAAMFAASRAAEYDRETGGRESRQPGSFKHAVVTDHLPTLVKRMKTLYDLAGALGAFYGNDDESSVLAAPYLSEAFALVARHETEILEPMEAIARSDDEEAAKKKLRELVFVAQSIALAAKALWEKSITELEKAVTTLSVCCDGLECRFVSVVSIDLAQYGRHIEVINSYTEAEGVFSFNRKIRQKIQQALAENGFGSKDVITINTGDGALLLFLGNRDESPEPAKRAYAFSTSFLDAFNGGSEGVKRNDHQLHFRVGICTGVVATENTYVRMSGINQCNAGGVAIGTAVRLQSAAEIGEIVVCAQTWKYFDRDVRDRFSGQVEVPGKPHENSILAHRCQFVNGA
jgi:class 3 adenylate cyclase